MSELNYFCIENIGTSNIQVSLKKQGSFTSPVLEYSRDLSSWSTFDIGWNYSVSPNAKIYLRGNNSTFSAGTYNNYLYFDIPNTYNGKVKVSGNIMSLADKTCESTVIPATYFFVNLFKNCQTLIDVGDLILPAATTKDGCYNSMFYGCTKLINVPNMTAITYFAQYCCQYMFFGCSSLYSGLGAETFKNIFVSGIYLPKLSEVKTFDWAWAQGIFGGAYLGEEPFTLPTVEEMPNLKYCCFTGLNSGCTNIKNVPASYLPWTQLNGACYRYLFENCTALETAPDLPAQKLVDRCYNYMFAGCSSLKNVPVFEATTMGSECCRYMFQGCTSLVVAPKIKATTLAARCFEGMFTGCTSLKSVSDLRATYAHNNCYNQMFAYCTSLEAIPQIYATTFETRACEKMFYNCSKVKVYTTNSSSYYAYRLPKAQTVSVASGTFTDMFVGTGGSFTSTPTVNTTYYISIVDEVPGKIIINLNDYSLEAGTHTITATTNKTGYRESEPSNELTYIKE